MFGTGYLIIWLSTNLYLNHTFKTGLSQAVSSASHKHYRLDIESVKTGPYLNSLTIRNLDLMPSDINPKKKWSNHDVLHIAELEIPCPDICFVLFSPGAASASTQQISREILSLGITD
jgi:hypothetical protein